MITIGSIASYESLLRKSVSGSFDLVLPDVDVDVVVVSTVVGAIVVAVVVVFFVIVVVVVD